jgi:hypothetical protein
LLAGFKKLRFWTISLRTIGQLKKIRKKVDAQLWNQRKHWKEKEKNCRTECHLAATKATANLRAMD